MAPSCDSGAVANSSGAVGCSRHLVGATLLPGVVLVGGGRGHGVGGGYGGTVGGPWGMELQYSSKRYYFIKLSPSIVCYILPPKFCIFLIKNYTIINLYCKIIHLP